MATSIFRSIGKSLGSSLPKPVPLGTAIAVGGAAGTLPPGGIDLSFLTDPNNPYVQAMQDPGYGDYPDSVVQYVDGGGYAAPSLPPYDPATDPSYQALLAQLGLSESLARNQAETQRAIAGRQAATQVPRIQEAGIEQRRGIGFNAESRGMFRSGQRLRDLSLQQRGESQRLADVYSGLSDRMAGIDLGLQGKVNDIANQRAQAAFEAKLRASGA